MSDPRRHSSLPPSPTGTLGRCRADAGPHERVEMVRALRAALDWLLALERRAARGQEGGLIRPREVAIEIAAVTRELTALGADLAGGDGIRFVLS